MYQNILKVFVVFVLCLDFSNANVSDYQKLYQEGQEDFNLKMKEEIKKSLPKASKKVQNLYKAIGYRPVWVDKDYLTQYAELLVYELQEDFDKGLDSKLVVNYKKLLPEDKKIFTSNSLKERVDVELGIMQLYVDHIDEILKAKKSKYTPLTLLQYALKEKSLICALNAICDERIAYRTALGDFNGTTEKNSIKISLDSIEILSKGKDKERISVLYKLLNFQPIWMTDNGFSKHTQILFKQIENDITLDKSTKTYQTYEQIKAMPFPAEKEKVIALEFKIAKLYQDYMSHALYGDIDWDNFQKILKKRRNADWVVHHVLASPESLLIEAMGKGSVSYAFKEAKPLFPLYDRLLGALKKYQTIVENGGWKALPTFKSLKPGMTDSAVPLIRERLIQEGDYNVTCVEDNNTEYYDECLLSAVQKFQTRHGLTSEGFIGKLTQHALSESAESKVLRIKLNLDRMKWIKRSHERYQIWVNIPGFEMLMYDEKQIIQRMKVIVGRKGHNTPVFYNRVRTIVLNPYWRIPASIIRGELIPKLKKNPHYTNQKKIEIHTGYSEHSPRVNPLKVNWHKYGRRLPPYKFMQSPGVHNALGKMKFLFPNKYSVYMHDTNQKNLFVKDKRALSHGCVRLHKPRELLKNFADLDPRLDFKKAQETLKHNKKTPIRLSHAVPVDLVYLTTWVEMDGTVHFREDIYGYDDMQLAKNDN